MELTNMTNEELQSIVEKANNIIHDRTVKERNTYANAIIEAIHKFRDSGGSIYIEGTVYDIDECGDSMSTSVSGDIDCQSVFEIDEYGDLTIKDLYFERSE